MKEQNAVTNEQAREALDRILNFCEEIDNHIPPDETTGYKMLPDYFIVSRYLNEADYRKQKEGKWIFEFNLDGDDFYKCSVCGRQEVLNGLCNERNIAKHLPYCHCGAQMRGGKNE